MSVCNPNFDSVVLQISFDNLDNGLQAFTDVSNSSAPLGAIGAFVDTTQAMFGPSSAVFNNALSQSQISTPITTGSPLDFTGEDFTIECWIRPTVAGGGYGFLATFGGTTGFIVGVDSSNNVFAHVDVSGTQTPLTGAGAAIPINTWTAVAFVRQGTTYTVYVNGVAALALTAVATDTSSSGNFWIGIVPSFANVSLTGNIDEVRVTKGIALYTSTYTPATTAFGTTCDPSPPDAFEAFVTLLLHADGSQGSTTFTDSSPAANVFTPTGSPIIDDNVPRFGTGALSLPTTSDFISAPATPGGALDISAGDFTVECWANPNNGATTQIFLRCSDGSTNGFLFYIFSGGYLVQLYQGGAFVANIFGATAVSGKWTHIAFVRQGNAFDLWCDGAASGVFNGSSASMGAPTNPFEIHATSNIGGYVDEVRVTKGFARYTPGTNFVPPNLPFANPSAPPAPPPGDLLYYQVGLLLTADYTWTFSPPNTAVDVSLYTSLNNGLMFGPGQGTNFVASGGPFSGPSPYFDLAFPAGGTSDGYNVLMGAGGAGSGIVAGSALDCSVGDYTVEGWFLNRGGSTQKFFGVNSGASLSVVGNAGVLSISVDGTSLPAGAYTLNTWHHIAICRQSNSAICYVDGVATGAGTSVTPTTWAGHNLDIGGPSASFAGAFTNFRVTNGTARYLTTFTPPTAPFPSTQAISPDADFADVSLYLSFDGFSGSTSFTDNSNENLLLTPSGTPSIGSAPFLFGSGVLELPAGATMSTPSQGPGGPLDLATGDWTVECWWRSTNPIAGQSGQMLEGVDSSAVFQWTLRINAGPLFAQVQPLGGGFVNVTSTVTPVADTWYNLVFVRQGNTLGFAVDGVWAPLVTQTGAIGQGTGTYRVTVNALGSGNTSWLDEVRITKGIARYAPGVTFPVQTLPWGASGDASPTDSDFSHVSLLMHADGNNRQLNLIDSGPQSLTLTSAPGTSGGSDTGANGSYFISNDNPKFGSGSLHANEEQSVQSPVVANGPLDLSTGDWTIEGFYCPVSPPGGGSGGGFFLRINDLIFAPSGAGRGGVFLELGASSELFVTLDGDSVSAASHSGSPGGTTVGQWAHFAAVCSGGVLTSYLNGVNSGTTGTQPASAPWAGGNLYIGNIQSGSQFYGQIDEVRITKGIARYTSNFTPPTLAFGTGGATTTVPNVVGLALATAEADIVGASLTVGTVTTSFDPTIPAGDVISTNPVGGTVVSIGSSVDIVNSLGPMPPPVIVPNVVGLSLASASSTITGATLTVGTVTTASSMSVPAGDVISQSPIAGIGVSPGTPVELLVSSGATTTVPNLFNTSVAVANALLTAAGLVPGVVTSSYNVLIIAGNIDTQSPASGTVVALGSAVNYDVSLGRAPLTVPDLFGLTETEAINLLLSLGLVPGAIGFAPAALVESGIVQAQNPIPGLPIGSGGAVSFIISTGEPVPSVLFDFEATVISQYANSPTILQLVQNMNEYVDQNANFAHFFNFVWNVDTAQGFGLDIWGKIVGVTRLLHIPTTVDYVGFDNSATPPPDWQTMGSDQPPQPAVGGAMYTGFNATQTFLLDDAAFRQLILAKAFANIALTSAPAINRILQNLYGPGAAWVLNAGVMSITYNLNFTPTAIQLAILEQSGVIPTPPGVSASVVIV